MIVIRDSLGLFFVRLNAPEAAKLARVSTVWTADRHAARDFGSADMARTFIADVRVTHPDTFIGATVEEWDE